MEYIVIENKIKEFSKYHYVKSRCPVTTKLITVL
jgi:hypothetical protein